jgi:LysR family glycine cleavage system transcriptional activator
MSRRLPSLNALRAFEAAAGHESFTLAAQELFVTHAAVSRHIRDLEEWLGLKLFHRTGRGVVLNEAGARYAGELTPLFDGLQAATREVMAAAGTRRLEVSVEPAIASRWLVARLGRFNALHPDIELSLDPDNDVSDLRSGDAEIGLRYGRGGWPDIEAIRLTDLVFFPVCSPEYLARFPVAGPGELDARVLLHEDSRQWWREWLEAAGAGEAGGRRGPMFQNHLALEAAEAGQGFALADQVLAGDALAEGWLVKPFAFELADHGGYYLVRAAGTRESTPARAFREWLIAEMAETARTFAALHEKRHRTKA